MLFLNFFDFFYDTQHVRCGIRYVTHAFNNNCLSADLCMLSADRRLINIHAFEANGVSMN